MSGRGWRAVALWACCCCWGAARALQRPQCAPGRACVAGGDGSSQGEYTYKIDGENIIIQFNDGEFFKLQCEGDVTLDSPALPRFSAELSVRRVVLAACPVPARSYRAALAALGVRARDSLGVSRAAGLLARRHLAALGVPHLALADVRLAPDAPDALDGTRRLHLEALAPPPLERLPASLERLHLTRTGLTSVSRAQLAHLPRLRVLVVRDDTANVTVEAGAPLRELALEADDVRLAPALPASLEQLTVRGWGEATPPPYAGCAGLRELRLLDSPHKLLPGGWLARCSRLRELTLSRVAVRLEARALAGPGAALERLSLTHCDLRSLPEGLLEDAPGLLHLDLSGNHLIELPPNLFGSTQQLMTLNMSNNDLTKEAFKSVAVVKSLRVLRLDHNVRLGDACSGGVNAVRGISDLKDLKLLEVLGLRNTSAEVMCRDWRDDMGRLRELDLGANRFEVLTAADLQFPAAVTVDLRDNRVTRLLYDYGDYARLAAAPARYCGARAPDASRAHVRLSAALRCDCNAMWAALALRECGAHVSLEGARCESGEELRAVELARLQCSRPPHECLARPPAACSCAARWQAPAPSARPTRVLHVRCVGANLTQLPRLTSHADTAWELNLTDNHIVEPIPTDLPHDLLELDLRHNGVERAQTVCALLAERRRVWLGASELRCDCADTRALHELSARRHLLRDYEALACAGGAPLAPRDDCAPPGDAAPLLVALVPLAVALALAAACVARGEWRAALKRALRRWGWWPRGAGDERDDAARPYDVFLSFSHHDEATVRTLLERLEGGATPYRVLVHWRDWAPGGWIPAQIAASVRRSRRTLAVVSAHFLRSQWALAEFREAYAAALRSAEPRLVVLLLDEPARLPLDAELRRYLAHNTYLRWGDAFFWRKLRAALPPPRARASPAAAEPLVLQLCPRALEEDASAAA